MELNEILLLTVVGAAIAALTTFLLLYDSKLPWWESSYGRSIVAMKLAVLGVAIGAVVRNLDYHLVADVLLTVAWAAVAGVMIWRTRMLWQDTKRSTGGADAEADADADARKKRPTTGFTTDQK